jgi:hypothetical protein
MRPFLLGFCIGCAGSAAKDAPTLTTGGEPIGDDDDDDGVPPGERCADPGPDAPVTESFTPTQSVFEGYDVLSWFPSDPRGVVWYFHGGANITEVMDVEQVAFLNLMAAQDIGVVVTEKDGGSWDSFRSPVDDNRDLPRLERLRDALIADGSLGADTPILAAGFSDGGGMAAHFAKWMDVDRGWPIAAALVHSGGGGELPEVPLWLTVTEHDVGGVGQTANRLYEDALASGQDAVLVLDEERTATVECFLRKDEWDLVDAQEAFDDFVAGGLIDPDGTRLVPDQNLQPALDAYTDSSQMIGAAHVAARMHVMWALHRFNAQHAGDECDFAMDAIEAMER